MDKKIDATAFESHVVKLFKLTTEEVASLYNEAGELTNWDLIESKDAERVTKFKTDNTSQYNLGFKKGAEGIENKIRTKFGIDSDVELTGVDLVDHIVETKVAEVAGSGDKDIMTNPEVLKLINTHSKEKKELVKEWSKKLEDKEREINESNLFKDVEMNALTRFETLKPILPENPKKAQALKDILRSDLKKYKYQKEGDTFIVLKEDGTALTDSHGNSITFDDHVKNVAETYFDFKVANDRSNAGNNNNNNQNNNRIRTPKDKNDYVDMMKDQSLTPEERVAIMEKATEAKII